MSWFDYKEEDLIIEETEPEEVLDGDVEYLDATNDDEPDGWGWWW